MNFIRPIFLFTILFTTSFWSLNSSALKVPELTAPVIDEAGVIGSRTAQELDQLAREANSRGKLQLTVLTLKSLDGQEIEQASIEIADKWKLGQKGKDNGIIFIVVPSERKARIEVGRGLEGDIPDVIAKRILADVSRPYFKRGLYGDGILAGTLQILKYADPEMMTQGMGQQVNSQRGQEPVDELPDWAKLIIIIAVLIIIVFGRFIGFFGGFGGGGFGGGGFGGGGGWGGGGGGFSGGGSSDSW